MRNGTHPCYNNPRWRTISRSILARDAWQCRIGLPGCTIRATTTDHIIPLADGGEWYDPSNLRGSLQEVQQHYGSAPHQRYRHRLHLT